MDLKHRHPRKLGKNFFLPSSADFTKFLDFSTNDIDLNFIVKKKPAPRSYCDICEVFDAHETEECPTQCSSEVDLPPRRSSKERKLPPARKFCLNCDSK